MLLKALSFRLVRRRNSCVATDWWRKGFVKSIPNVVCRAQAFHFRRAVPIELRRKLRRTELVCTLHTGNAATAKLTSRLLYVRSERLFEQVRNSPMLSEEQLSLLVKDFYATVISQENALRLGVSQPINEEARLARVAYHKSLAEQTRDILAKIFSRSIILFNSRSIILFNSRE
jgi:hypothetical protein